MLSRRQIVPHCGWLQHRGGFSLFTQVRDSKLPLLNFSSPLFKISIIRCVLLRIPTLPIQQKYFSSEKICGWISVIENATELLIKTVSFMIDCRIIKPNMLSAIVVMACQLWMRRRRLRSQGMEEKKLQNPLFCSFPLMDVLSGHNGGRGMKQVSKVIAHENPPPPLSSSSPSSLLFFVIFHSSLSAVSSSLSQTHFMAP